MPSDPVPQAARPTPFDPRLIELQNEGAHTSWDIQERNILIGQRDAYFMGVEKTRQEALDAAADMETLLRNTPGWKPPYKDEVSAALAKFQRFKEAGNG